MTDCLVTYARVFLKSISQRLEQTSTARNLRSWREMSLSQSLFKFGTLQAKRDIKVQVLHSIEELRHVSQCMISQMQELLKTWQYGSRISWSKLTLKIQTTFLSLSLATRQTNQLKEKYEFFFLTVLDSNQQSRGLAKEEQQHTL